MGAPDLTYEYAAASVYSITHKQISHVCFPSNWFGLQSAQPTNIHVENVDGISNVPVNADPGTKYSCNNQLVNAELLEFLTDDIVAFINRFTTHVEGVGDICSLAAFNLQVGADLI